MASTSVIEPARDERPPAAPVVEHRTRPRNWKPSDTVELAGSMASAVAVTWLLFARLTPLSGTVGFFLVAFILFLAIYRLVVREQHGLLVARDRMASALVCSGAAVLFGVILSVIAYTAGKGMKGLRHPNFLTDTMEFAGPLDPLTEGGAFHAIVGTVEQLLIATVLCVPLAIATAVFLNEIGGRSARLVRILVDAMFGIPSVVAGLFIYATWILGLGNEFSGFAATLALSILMLPIVTRTAEEMLRLVPGGLREAALALGAPEWRMVLRVVLPTARAGLITASMLGAARVVGETAPVLLTAFGSPVLNANPFSDPQQTLSLMAFQLIRSFQGADVDRAWGAALCLLCIVFLLFAAARTVANRQPADPGRDRDRALGRAIGALLGPTRSRRNTRA